MTRSYQVCMRCIMDTSAKDITFDEKGICNYCSNYLKQFSSLLNKSSDQRKLELDAFVKRIKEKGKGKRYDCIIGVSGGVDSSYALLQAVNLGLRPLAVHMDNGWNSELAQNNIANLVRGLNVDLFTYVIDWSEYRKLMQAFFDADVIDVELLYDNAMLAVNYQQAAKHHISYILAGTNKATEGMVLPAEWIWHKKDKKNIKGIAKKFGHMKLNSFPAIGVIDYVLCEFVRRIKWISFLDYFDYNKFEALNVLESGYGYKPYPYKHYESIFTRFYQGYILPQKFGVDKRRLHLSTLIASNQMSRDEALQKIAEIPYPSQKALEEDTQYFLKKMGWSMNQLTSYLSRPEIPHSAYPSETPLWDFFFIDKEGRYFYKAAKYSYRMLRSISSKFR